MIPKVLQVGDITSSDTNLNHGVSRFHRRSPDHKSALNSGVEAHRHVLNYSGPDHCWEPPTTHGLDFAVGHDLRLATRRGNCFPSQESSRTGRATQVAENGSPFTVGEECQILAVEVNDLEND
jgi:hypothetical protein